MPRIKKAGKPAARVIRIKTLPGQSVMREEVYTGTLAACVAEAKRLNAQAKRNGSACVYRAREIRYRLA